MWTTIPAANPRPGDDYRSLLDWEAWLAEKMPPGLSDLAKRINREMPDVRAVVSRHPGGPHRVWIVQGIRQDFITTWEEAQAFAGLAVQGTLFGS